MMARRERKAVTTAHIGLRQRDSEFEVSLSHTVKPCQSQKTTAKMDLEICTDGG